MAHGFCMEYIGRGWYWFLVGSKLVHLSKDDEEIAESVGIRTSYLALLPNVPPRSCLDPTSSLLRSDLHRAYVYLRSTQVHRESYQYQVTRRTSLLLSPPTIVQRPANRIVGHVSKRWRQLHKYHRQLNSCPLPMINGLQNCVASVL
jgi:hypothetical protein